MWEKNLNITTSKPNIFVAERQERYKMNEFDFDEKLDGKQVQVKPGVLKLMGKRRVSPKIYQSIIAQDIDESEMEEGYINVNGEIDGWQCRAYDSCSFVTDDETLLAEHIIQHYVEDFEMDFGILKAERGVIMQCPYFTGFEEETEKEAIRIIDPEP